MNINGNARNKKKIGRKIKGVYLQNVRTSLDYKTWYQIKVETLPFDYNAKKCELSALNIHEY